MLTILWDTIYELEQQMWPQLEQERGGLLVGERSDLPLYEGTKVAAAIPVPNICPEPEREYRPDPAVISERLRAIERGGFELLGTYHSHPNGKAVMSRGDLGLVQSEGSPLLLLIANPGRDEPAEWEWGLFDRHGEVEWKISPPHV